MNLPTPISIPAHVLAEPLDNETVLLDMSNGTYFGLDPVGSAFWRLLAEGTKFEDIPAILLQEFDVDAQVLEQDLESLLAELETKKLIERKANQ